MYLICNYMYIYMYTCVHTFISNQKLYIYVYKIYDLCIYICTYIEINHFIIYKDIYFVICQKIKIKMML